MYILTIYILIDFPIQIDTIRIGLSTIYFDGQNFQIIIFLYP